MHKIGGFQAEVQYAGVQSEYTGLDQIDVNLPPMPNVRGPSGCLADGGETWGNLGTSNAFLCFSPRGFRANPALTHYFCTIVAVANSERSEIARTGAPIGKPGDVQGVSVVSWGLPTGLWVFG